MEIVMENIPWTLVETLLIKRVMNISDDDDDDDDDVSGRDNDEEWWRKICWIYAGESNKSNLVENYDNWDNKLKSH